MKQKTHKNFKEYVNSQWNESGIWDKDIQHLLKHSIMGFPGSSDGKASACNVEDLGLIPGSGRFPGERNGNPPQYSCLENSMDEGAW